MARKSLKPQLNQIRAWVQQGRTGAWIAHQLEISAQELREFRKQYDLTPDDENAGSGEIDLGHEIEAEIEAATEAEEVETADDEDEGDEDEERPEPGSGRRRRRRRGRRGGRGRRKEIEGSVHPGATPSRPPAVPGAAVAAAAAVGVAEKRSRRPSIMARPTATDSGSTPRSK